MFGEKFVSVSRFILGELILGLGSLYLRLCVLKVSIDGIIYDLWQITSTQYTTHNTTVNVCEICISCACTS